MGRKKSKARQKRINSIDIQIKFPNGRSEINFASEPSSKNNFRIDDRIWILPNPKVASNQGTNKRGFPKLPMLSNSMRELSKIDAESFLTPNWKVASCDNICLTSTLTPLPSSWEFREIEANALRMDRCCSFELDCIIFKDTLPCIGNCLQEEMMEILDSLQPKTAFSFKSKIYDISYMIDHSISAYNSVCKAAAVRIDMLTTTESMLTEKVSRQRSQIEELENKVEKLTDLISETHSLASDKFEKQCIEMDQKDKIIRSLEEKIEILEADKFREQNSELDKIEKPDKPIEEGKDVKDYTLRKLCSEFEEKINLKNKIKKLMDLINETKTLASDNFKEQQTELEQRNKIIGSLEEEIKILKANKFRRQNSELDKKDKTIISDEEKILKEDKFRKLCPKFEEENKTIQLSTETASLKEQKMDSDNSESRQNIETEYSKSRENLVAERKTEAETEISEFNRILELGKYLSKNLLSIQKTREMRSLQNETKCLKETISGQMIRQEELNSLKSQNEFLTDQLQTKKKILSFLDTKFPSLRNDILVKSTRIQELEKSIENMKDELERSSRLILSLQEENKVLKLNLTPLEISSSKISHSFLETPRLPRDRDGEIEVRIVPENNETEQSLQKIEKINSSHFKLTEENNDEESFELESTLKENALVNSILLHHPDNPEGNNSTANSLQEDIQNLKRVIEIQQLSLHQISTFVKKLAKEISSIKLQNLSLSERLDKNESNLALLKLV